MLSRPAARHASNSYISCTCQIAAQQLPFSTSAPRNPRLSAYLPTHTENGPPKLSRRVRESLTKRDRIVGFAETGEKLPFRETEWGLRFARKKRMEEREVKMETKLAVEREQAENKRVEAVALTAALPPLTEDALRLFYEAVMAPPALSAPSTPSQPQLSVPDDTTRVALLEELDQRVKNAAATSRELEASTDSRAKLNSVIALLDATITRTEQRGGPVTAKALALSNLATLDEWKALAVEAVDAGEVDSVVDVLKLLKRTGSTQVATVSSTAARACTRRGDVTTLQRLLEACQEADIALASDARESLVEALVLRGELIGAQHQLRHLEETGSVPSMSAYNGVIAALFNARQPSSAWDLFGHMRLAAHATPNAQVYATMIEAAAKGDAPERANDLRREMEENGVQATASTFTAIILACARGPPELYADALRHLRQMIHDGFKPTRETLQAVLHGAMRVGDLARARWVFDKMCEAAEAGQRDLAPDEMALKRLFHTYAKYKAPLRSVKLAKSTSTAVATAGDSSSDSSSEASEAGTFPGPMPQTRGEVARALEATMQRWLAAREVDIVLRASSLTPRWDDVAFASIRLNDMTADAYLDALACHAPFKRVLDHFKRLYSSPSPLRPTLASYAHHAHRCRRYGDKDAVKMVSDIFGDYQKQCEPFTVGQQVLEHGATISKLYADVIFCLVKAGQPKQAIAALERFMQLYPPRLLTDYAEAVSVSRTAAPSSPVRLASRAFPETASVGPRARLMPPFLRFIDLHLLYSRSKEQEDRPNMRKITMIARHYEQALEWAQRIAEPGSKTVARGVILQGKPAPSLRFDQLSATNALPPPRRNVPTV